MAELSPFPLFSSNLDGDVPQRRDKKGCAELLDGSEDFCICKRILELFVGVYMLHAISLSLSLSLSLCLSLFCFMSCYLHHTPLIV